MVGEKYSGKLWTSIESYALALARDSERAERLILEDRLAEIRISSGVGLDVENLGD